MKKLALSLLALLFIGSTVSHAEWQSDYARLLAKYVTGSGVRYAEWKANTEDLKAIGSVVDAIANAPASAAKSKEQLANINAYNAWILHEALEKFPTKSVKDTLFTFFTANRITVAGEKMSFNHLEKDVIRARFGEPRIHFALNCASRSCPPLRAEPYTGAKMDAQLDDQARQFLSTEKGVRMTKEGAEASKVFDWYKDDFASVGGVIPFINKHRSPPLAPNAKISYQDYDWRLNEAK